MKNLTTCIWNNEYQEFRLATQQEHLYYEMKQNRR